MNDLVERRNETGKEILCLDKLQKGIFDRTINLNYSQFHINCKILILFHSYNDYRPNMSNEK